MPTDKHVKTRLAYQFLKSREGQLVSSAEIREATQWADGTVRSYLSKNWKPFLIREGSGIYRVTGVSRLTEDDFVGVQKQVKDVQIDPRVALVQGALRDGESQETEFKSAIPNHATDLCKEIAAFATSNDGFILLGVTDDGRRVGFTDDVERVEGIIRNVQPPVSATINLVTVDGKQICLIHVRKGTEPAYYHADRAYIRQGTLSRPATPEEVKELHRSHFRPRRGGGSLQRGAATFPQHGDTIEVTIIAVDPFRTDFGFSPTGDVAGELVSPSTLRFTRMPGSQTPFVIYWIRMR